MTQGCSVAVEGVYELWFHAEPDGLADCHGRFAADSRQQRIGKARNIGIEEGVAAELLAHQHPAAQRARYIGPNRRQMFRADADLDLASRRGERAATSTETSPGKASRSMSPDTPCTRPGRKFIFGEPMKPATKRFAGLR